MDTQIIPQGEPCVNPEELVDHLRRTFRRISNLSKNKRGVCTMNYPLLAEQIGISRSQLYRHLSDLEALACIKIEKKWKRKNAIRPLIFFADDPRHFCDSHANLPSTRANRDSESLESKNKRTTTQTPPLVPLPAPVVVPLATPNSGIPEFRNLPVSQELEREGVFAATAQKLAQGTPPERLLAYLRAYQEARREGKAKKVGWLVTAIREGWKLEEAKAVDLEVWKIAEAGQLPEPEWQKQIAGVRAARCLLKEKECGTYYKTHPA